MTYRVLQIGNPTSPLNFGIGTAAQSEEIDICWFSHIKCDLPGVHHYSMPGWIANNFLLRAIFEPFFLAQVIRIENPDLVQVHYAFKGLATIPIVRRHPLIVTTMGSDLAPSVGYKFPYRYWINLMLRRGDVVITRSNFMKKRLLEIGVPDDKIMVNSWGIDLDHFKRLPDQSDLKRKWGVPEDAFIFLDPRSTNPIYNKDIIMRAFSRVARKIEQKIHLLVAGVFSTSEQIEDLHNLVAELDIADQVTFVGSVDYQQMPELYSLAECTISIPSSDGMPQTIFEAWGCGSFLIVGDLPQYDEFIEDGLTGKRVPIRDVEATAQAMLWVLGHEEFRKRAIPLGQERAAHFADRRAQKASMRDLVRALLSLPEEVA